MFLGGVILIVLNHIFRSGHIDFNTICAALSVYLLIAILWTQFYGLAELLDPGAFVYNTPIGGETTSMQMAGGKSFVAIYYSLVTITTLGYGDIVPVSPAATMLATVEAVVGQFYLTVLVAWLVGMYISSTMQAKQTE
jgi:voltage-gated potassium channel Kch